MAKIIKAKINDVYDMEINFPVLYKIALDGSQTTTPSSGEQQSESRNPAPAQQQQLIREEKPVATLDQWQAAKTRIESIVQELEGLISGLTPLFASAATKLPDLFKTLNILGFDDPTRLASALSTISFASARTGFGSIDNPNFDIEGFQKFSEDYIAANRHHRKVLLKRAGIIDNVGQAASATFNVLRYAPTVMHGIMAFRNLKKGFDGYKKLVAKSKDIGLTWYQTLWPPYLSAKINQFSDDPDKLATIVEISSIAPMFIKNCLMLILNSLTAAKDMLPKLAEALKKTSVGQKFGWLINFLPFISLLVGMGLDKIGLKLFDNTRQKVMGIINSNIERLSGTTQSTVGSNQPART